MVAGRRRIVWLGVGVALASLLLTWRPVPAHADASTSDGAVSEVCLSAGQSPWAIRCWRLGTCGFTVSQADPGDALDDPPPTA